MDIHKAIAAAEKILPGQVAPDGETDERWQAIILIEEHIEKYPDEVWNFAAKWGCHNDEDLRTAIGVLLLERLLEHHFAAIFPRLEAAVRTDKNFAHSFMCAWKLGHALEPKNAARFDSLRAEIRDRN